MPNNCGTTTLKRARRAGNPMQDYDALPRELRHWVSSAALPWRAKSVRAAYDRALARTGNPQKALEELDGIQRWLVTKDVARIWGKDHPSARAVS
ncbi:DUF6525 family protein [Thalassococcus lentus]|uniref:DUF6525 family protein n=1 Tax=Thalassococcus lentus TaxID=1210524 RepID=A0ABT4XVZ7_9RHOB|nr:DUF6525 family protein [Thalassococcus lentus]MDA7426141.1 DUF6525 family protein [Thalassococcus lentus]